MMHRLLASATRFRGRDRRSPAARRGPCQRAGSVVRREGDPARRKLGRRRVPLRPTASPTCKECGATLR